MKNKLIVLSLLFAGAFGNTYAQENTKQKYVASKWSDNFFISVGGGAQVMTNPDNLDLAKFGESVSPHVTLSLGKLITPVWGVRAQLTGWQTKLNTDYNISFYEYFYEQKKYREYDAKKFITLNADAMFNLSNFFAGYKEGRKFEFILFGGPTLTGAKPFRSWKSTQVGPFSYEGKEYTDTKQVPANHKFKFLVGASVGLGAKYNINNYWAIDLEARGSINPSIYGVADRLEAEGSASLTAGVSYIFGGKKFKPCGAAASPIVQDAINQQVNDERAKYEALQAELADAKKALQDAQAAPKEIINTERVVGPYAIFFEIGKANISDRGMVNIKFAAKSIKANPGKKYKVAAYADKTGSSDLNKRLTENRAKAVYDALISEGVSKDQLELLPEGAQDNMFGKNELNRVVILE